MQSRNASEPQAQAATWRKPTRVSTIDNAIDQWALEKGKKDNDPAGTTGADGVRTCIKGGDMPTFPGCHATRRRLALRLLNHDLRLQQAMSEHRP